MFYRSLALIFTLAILSVTLLSWNNQPDVASLQINADALSVENAMMALGGKKYNHGIDQADPAQVEIGRQLILRGRARINGKRSKLISIHFVCTDCHNLVKETEDPAELDPEARLKYAINNNLNFMPGSTLWGIYNRNHWYNGDYAKKYGDIIKAAVDSLPEAVQVCAKYCSSGRFLEPWELKAIMHYFKAHELHISDLPLQANEKEQLTRIGQLNEEEKSVLLRRIESSFVRAFPATHVETMPRDSRKYGEGFNAENGKKIFELSCLSCHLNKRVTYLNLEKDKLTARMFWANIKDYNDLTIYQIIRWGTWAKVGRKQYMPHYTKEKMSDRQIEDLVAYIRQLANK